MHRNSSESMPKWVERHKTPNTHWTGSVSTKGVDTGERGSAGQGEEENCKAESKGVEDR